MSHEAQAPRQITPTIHARGHAARLDAVLEMVAFAARPCPLTTSLDEIPRKIAAILNADVCSIYLLESDHLVMRGNVGFPWHALGEVRMAVGEGLTGMAVELMRPVSIETAADHERYRHFPGIGEERFPIFLAVPVAGPHGPLGAVVLQRREGPGFTNAEIERAAALTVPIAAATERAHMVAALRGERRSAGGGTRRVTLPGRTVVPGRAVGAVSAFRRPASRPGPEPQRSQRDIEHTLEQAVSQALRTLESFEKRAAALQLPSGLFVGVRTILDDGRLRERVLELTAQGQTLAQSLGAIGAEVGSKAARSGDPFGVERAREIGDICESLAMLCATDRRAELPRSAVLVGDHVTMFDLIVSSRAQPAAVVLSSSAEGPMARAMLALLGVPAVTSVEGVFRWVSDGDIALIDADHGLVRVNPSRAEIAIARAETKRARKHKDDATK